MKSIYRIFVLMGLAFLPSFVLAAPGFSGLGSGTDVDPYQISSCSLLNEIRYIPSANFILTTDLDCTMDFEELGDLYNTGYGFNPIGSETTPFSGVFDGGGYTITGLMINQPESDYIGFFGYVTGSISDLNLSSVNIAGFDRVGGLVGRLGLGGTINNCSVSGIVGGNNYVGGLVGGSLGNISNSSSNIEITNGSNYVGGLVGGSAGEINNSSSEGVIDTSGSSWNSPLDFSIGGLVGVLSETGVINESHSSVNVTAPFAAGGLVGSSLGDVYDSYATGSVSADNEYAGGLVGSLSGNVYSSYATGSVLGGSHLGGLVGVVSDGGNIYNSYSSGNIEMNSAGYRAGGLAGAVDTGSVVVNSYSTGNVTTTDEGVHIGGLVGGLNGFIQNSYSTGDVFGFSIVGGLVGRIGLDGGISDSYFSGNLSGDSFVGNIIGDSLDNPSPTSNVYFYNSNENQLEYCYYSFEHVGISEGCNIADSNEYFFNYSNSPILKGVEDGWDFSEDWSDYYENSNHPILAFFAPDISNFTVSYSASNGGYIEGETSQTIQEGNSASEVVAVANKGYRFKEWSDGLEDESRIDINITENKSFTALFERAQSRVIGSISRGSSVSIGSQKEEVKSPTVETPSVENVANKFIFTKFMKLGITDNEVKELQKFLNSKGYLLALSGIGSIGNETNYFGFLTKSALMKFQQDNNLKPDGVFGPLTRGVVNKILGN